MKISYNWLKNYTDIDISPEKLSEILTNTGLEVEGIEKIENIKGGLQGVIVGKVTECQQHPNADKLKVCTVDIAEKECLSIVCGAPNVQKGQKVAVATIGTTLYPTPETPFKIKKSKIRGIESQGMLCAEDELGIGKSHQGILVLSEKATIGEKLSTILQLQDDYVIEIGLTPNRSDAMGHIGVIRDYIAYKNVHENQNLIVRWPEINPKVNEKPQNSIEFVDIIVENQQLCPKYSGLVLSDIKVAPSPEWLQQRLRNVGLTPINNVVDATNFVMLELGTPMHAFDLKSLKGKIVVKTAKQNEKFITLDGIERTLSSENLMITNGDDNLCIAGVFGGLHSGISNQTMSIFLESAYFDPKSIRKTAKQHNLSTLASFRYERGTDPELVEYALKRCATLILEIAGGKIAMNAIVVGNVQPKKKITFNYFRNNQLIGAEIPRETVNLILKNLDFEIIDTQEEHIELLIPTYRTDVNREADVTEEILRIYGFNKIDPPSTMKLSLGSAQKHNIEKIQEKLSEFLVSKGFFETMNNSLSQSTYIEKWGQKQLNYKHNVAIINPISKELNVMRQSLIFGMLETVEYNQNRQNPNLRLFEFGKIYKKENVYTENKRLIIAISGKKNVENWNNDNQTHDFYSLKGTTFAIFKRLGILKFIKEKPFHSKIIKGVELYCLNDKIGLMGIIETQLKDSFGIKNEVFVSDLDWDITLEQLKKVRTVYKEVPKTFVVRRDFSLLIDQHIQYEQIEEIARKTDKKLLKEVGLFDVYEGKNIPKGKKSYAVYFIFQDTQQTLNELQIDSVMNKIRTNLEQQIGAELRN